MIHVQKIFIVRQCTLDIHSAIKFIYQTMKKTIKIRTPQQQAKRLIKKQKRTMRRRAEKIATRRWAPGRLSRGAKRISNFLETNNIQFEQEYQFPNQIGTKINNCRFDFYLPEHNTIIEFHGQQHYRFTARFHKTNNHFLRQCNRDILKRNFCIENGTTFIELNYKDFKSSRIDERLTCLLIHEN